MADILETRHLRLMHVMKEDCNLTRASKALNLSQSALSTQIKELESRLATDLFLRVGRGMILSEAGHGLARLAQEVLPKLRVFEANLLNEQQTVRLATECYTGYQWLPDVLRSFHKRWPSIHIELSPNATGNCMAHILEGKLEIAISDVPYAHPNLEASALFEDELLVIVSRQHRLAESSALHFKQLAHDTLYHYAIPSECANLRPLCASKELCVQRYEVVPLTEVIVEFVRANMGFAILSQWAVKPYLKSKALVAIPLASRPRRQWSAFAHRAVRQKPWFNDLTERIAKHAPTP